MPPWTGMSSRRGHPIATISARAPDAAASGSGPKNAATAMPAARHAVTTARVERSTRSAPRSGVAGGRRVVQHASECRRVSRPTAYRPRHARP
ncbi:hypothetical protein M768_18580 [Cellulosimicrobium cellulans F16]|uniref:Uncharacterized protein n=1 Tax=Cellulosimicrobium cellulans F16 TaxID=1350482 RepID=A0A0M0F1Z4_CELCE|nr:hypothetical protein M768_18580 [Cellulosimicrobium cellulans F16]